MAESRGTSHGRMVRRQGMLEFTNYCNFNEPLKQNNLVVSSCQDPHIVGKWCFPKHATGTTVVSNEKYFQPISFYSLNLIESSGRKSHLLAGFGEPEKNVLHNLAPYFQTNKNAPWIPKPLYFEDSILRLPFGQASLRLQNDFEKLLL